MTTSNSLLFFIYLLYCVVTSRQDAGMPINRKHRIKLHELQYAEIVKAGTVRLASVFRKAFD